MKWSIDTKEYFKVLNGDIDTLKDLCNENKYFEEYINYYLDPSMFSDEELIERIKEDKYDALKKGELVKYITLNAFDGAFKKIKTKKKK